MLIHIELLLVLLNCYYLSTLLLVLSLLIINEPKYQKLNNLKGQKLYNIIIIYYYIPVFTAEMVDRIVHFVCTRFM